MQITYNIMCFGLVTNSNRKGEHVEKITTTAADTVSELAQLAMQLAILAQSVLPNAQCTGSVLVCWFPALV